MSTGNWLKTHRKQVITHTSIIVAFVVFLIFVSGPLFARLEHVDVPGESQLCETTIPAETNNIQYCFDLFQLAGNILEIRGWAFVKGYDSVDNEKYIVLKAADRTYVFTTEIMVRESVTERFKESGLNLDYSGFSALIPTTKVADGDYSIGIYIREGDIEALQYVGRRITF